MLPKGRCAVAKLRREGDVVNKPLTPREAVDFAFMKVRRLMDYGICESCALKVVSHDHGINHDHLFTLWEESHGED